MQPSPHSKILPVLCLLALAALILGSAPVVQAGPAALPAGAPFHNWSKGFGGVGSDRGNSVATDASGSIYMTGFFWFDADFGSGTLTSAGMDDIFLVKYDANGVPLWSKRFGNTSYDSGNSVAVDASGNVYVTGFFSGTVDFGGGPLDSSLGTEDIFLAKFNGDGDHLWSKSFGGHGADHGNSLGVDAFGNVYLTGKFYSSVNFGGMTLNSTGDEDIFLTKLDASGNHIWSKRFGGSGRDLGNDLAVDSSGSVFVTGYFSDSVDFGGGARTSAGFYDIFMAKYDAGGNHLWSKRFGGSEQDHGKSLAVDASGSVFITGFFYFSADFGGGALTSAGSADIFLAGYDTDGSHLWSKRFGSIGNEFGYHLAVDVSGNILITGAVETNIDFGGGELIAAGSLDICFAKFDGSGKHVWSRLFGGTGNEYGSSLAADASGSIFLTGTFANRVDFGGGPLVSAGDSSPDIFLARLVDAKKVFLPLVERK